MTIIETTIKIDKEEIIQAVSDQVEAIRNALSEGKNVTVEPIFQEVGHQMNSHEEFCGLKVTIR